MHCRHFKKIKQGLYKQNCIHIFVFVISNDNILHVDNTYMYNAKNVQIVLNITHCIWSQGRFEGCKRNLKHCMNSISSIVVNKESRFNTIINKLVCLSSTHILFFIHSFFFLVDVLTRLKVWRDFRLVGYDRMIRTWYFTIRGCNW